VIYLEDAVSGDIAACRLRLQRYFGVEAQFWLNLQTEYDLRMMKDEIWADIRPLSGAELSCLRCTRTDAFQLISFGLLGLEQIPS
jgi:plasmid maintenance system antidote protein VapI